jgi:hypothetical protein
MIGWLVLEDSYHVYLFLVGTSEKRGTVVAATAATPADEQTAWA